MVGLTSAVWTLVMFQMVVGVKEQPCLFRVLSRLVFEMLCTQCQNADLSSDIKTRQTWSSTVSEAELIIKNWQID